MTVVSSHCSKGHVPLAIAYKYLYNILGIMSHQLKSVLHIA
uniref:Uncharacterized protein n=1 Tax=Rhizophora mucronata TaxID=61149 RepID=A0A2P2NC89_RHIMU